MHMDSQADDLTKPEHYKLLLEMIIPIAINIDPTTLGQVIDSPSNNAENNNINTNPSEVKGYA